MKNHSRRHCYCHTQPARDRLLSCPMLPILSSDTAILLAWGASVQSGAQYVRRALSTARSRRFQFFEGGPHCSLGGLPLLDDCALVVAFVWCAKRRLLALLPCFLLCALLCPVSTRSESSKAQCYKRATTAARRRRIERASARLDGAKSTNHCDLLRNRDDDNDDDDAERQEPVESRGSEAPA